MKVLRGGEHPVVQTKGDANDSIDPWKARLDGTTAWQVRAVAPNLGWLIVWLRTPTVRNLTVFGAPLLLAVLGLWRIWRDPGGNPGCRASRLTRLSRGARCAGPRFTRHAAATFTTVSLALAGFNSPTNGGPGTYVSKRIFPGVRSSAAWNVRDASGGSAETNSDDTLSYSDALVTTTGNWATAFASNRYVEFDFNAPRPGGVTVSSAQFNYRMAASLPAIRPASISRSIAPRPRR